jgi:hypothetical protein
MSAIAVVITIIVGVIAFALGMAWRSLTDANFKKKRLEEVEREAADIIAKGHTEAELAKKDALLEATTHL